MSGPQVMKNIREEAKALAEALDAAGPEDVNALLWEVTARKLREGPGPGGLIAVLMETIRCISSESAADSELEVPC